MNSFVFTALFWTIVATYFISLVTTNETYYTATVIFFFLFMLLLIFYIIDILQFVGTAVSISSMFLSVGSLTVILTFIGYLQYLLINYAENIINNRVDTSYTNLTSGLQLVVFLFTWFLVKGLNKANMIDPVGKKIRLVYSSSWLLAAAVIASILVGLYISLHYYRADGFTNLSNGL